MIAKAALQQQVASDLQADLRPIVHESLNATFGGFSQKYQQAVFVKFFVSKQKLLTEKAVNQQLNQRVLTSFIDETRQEFALVMTDIAPRPLTGPLTTNLARAMGQQLAAFHRQVQSFPGILKVTAPFAKAQTDLAQLDDPALQKQIGLILAAFIPLQTQIEHELAVHSKTVLHGDVGVRNFQFVAGQLKLIDFERARLGVFYQDFIKLFYQDFACQPRLIVAFLQGYQPSDSQLQLSAKSQVFLILTTALGIMKYTTKIADPDFKAVGEQLLATVKSWLEQSQGLNHCLLKAK